jgi:hypothetical protein
MFLWLIKILAVGMYPGVEQLAKAAPFNAL